MTNVADAVAILPEWLRTEVERRIRFHLLELPILPAVAAEALALCRSEDSDAHEIAKILHRDPGLAGHVMCLANSPMFGTSTEIKSLQQALGRIGKRRIAEVVLLVTTKATTFETPKAWSGCIQHLHRLSLMSALYAKEVTKPTHTDGDVAFLAGLLHDMGWPVVMLLLQMLLGQHRVEELHHSMERSLKILSLKIISLITLNQQRMKPSKAKQYISTK